MITRCSKFTQSAGDLLPTGGGQRGARTPKIKIIIETTDFLPGICNAAQKFHQALPCQFRIQHSATGWRPPVSVHAYAPERGRFIAEDGRRLRLALAAHLTSGTE